MSAPARRGSPCGLPAMVPGGLSVPVALATALMQFASKDVTRAMMTGLGFDDGHVCASDGASGVRALGIDPAGGRPMDHDRAWWSGEVVQDAIARSRDAKLGAIFLAWSECGTGMQFPPLSQVMGDQHRGKPDGSVGLDGTILARIKALCEAVQGKRHRDCSAHSVAFNFGGPFDPVLASIEGRDGAPSIEVVIMPTRL